jgi:hypothetical protein
VPDAPAIAAATPVSWKVGLPDTPSPFVTLKPKPEVESVLAATVVPLVLEIMPVEAVSRLPEAPFKFRRRYDCEPPSVMDKPVLADK